MMTEFGGQSVLREQAFMVWKLVFICRLRQGGDYATDLVVKLTFNSDKVPETVVGFVWIILLQCNEMPSKVFF